jgi:hypothetical protein
LLEKQVVKILLLRILQFKTSQYRNCPWCFWVS